MPGIPVSTRATSSHPDACEHLSAEEELAAEESLSIYCKPVELYNILQRRAMRNPSFLQRCLHYRIKAKHKKRIHMAVSLTRTITESQNVFPMSICLARRISDHGASRQTAMYRIGRIFIFRNSPGIDLNTQVQANFTLPEVNKLAEEARSCSLDILFVSTATVGNSHLSSGVNSNSMPSDLSHLAFFEWSMVCSNCSDFQVSYFGKNVKEEFQTLKSRLGRQCVLPPTALLGLSKDGLVSLIKLAPNGFGDAVMIPLPSDNKSTSLLTLRSSFHAFMTNTLFTKMHAMVSTLFAFSSLDFLTNLAHTCLSMISLGIGENQFAKVRWNLSWFYSFAGKKHKFGCVIIFTLTLNAMPAMENEQLKRQPGAQGSYPVRSEQGGSAQPLSCYANRAGEYCLCGKVSLESLYMAWDCFPNFRLGQRAEIMSTVDLLPCILKSDFPNDDTRISIQVPSNFENMSTSKQVQITISAEEFGAKEKSPYLSYAGSEVPSSSLSHMIGDLEIIANWNLAFSLMYLATDSIWFHMMGRARVWVPISGGVSTISNKQGPRMLLSRGWLRLREGNVMFNYRYYNNKLQRTEVTEDFTCPFCLVKCACFKGLRCHLSSSHDLFNFEFWVSDECHAVNVSVKNDISRSEIVSDDVDPRVQTFFFCGKPLKRRTTADQSLKNAVGLESSFPAGGTDILEKDDELNRGIMKIVLHQGPTVPSGPFCSLPFCRFVFVFQQIFHHRPLPWATGASSASFLVRPPPSGSKYSDLPVLEVTVLASHPRAWFYMRQATSFVGASWRRIRSSFRLLFLVTDSPDRGTQSPVGISATIIRSRPDRDSVQSMSDCDQAVLQFAKTRKLSIERPDPRNVKSCGGHRRSDSTTSATRHLDLGGGYKWELHSGECLHAAQ
ncbi:Polycomb group protein EMBRYONIC FLOWER 2 [Glycine soja]|uniref:Polycomb group protein EMBRYONIC FLOWER 2 n=1 Tax=Glycine soja TaxID=3848 RepID=A0A445F1Y0_GLYSO|nr:Polycomb group protein EMBRYONIC FLOWER 2 [Glycine soja]